MNDQARPGLGTEVTIDPDNPWLGLSSYTEETRAYFHGRDEEAAELARRVQRKNLTVLFGQSGLGKTSLLRAGLVPRLRGEGFCPVYVRVDYSPSTPPPAEQIKQAIFRATAEAGAWTRPGSAIEGESLWEFLHHRGDLLRDAEGRTLLPLLIFDQFEEIFTLAQADDAGRRRAKEFVEELADLVENRPPAALEARIDRDEVAAEDFDFARADYRILIALREDYLAHLESVKGIMPSITQNRMRLARMTGAQALSAVMKPGGRLVSLEVAESIVRFVAGGAELANAEVEPSLLSLVCRELNTVRIAQGSGEISADLLAGSRDTILSEFYERALADQPDGVRRVIEDELLTESGYRESLAEERVQKALAAAGAAPDALAKLVDRRLLRIEERLDMRRVELTHDVLCAVVAASRDLRHEREARDEAERQLVAQREREAATRRALVRARTIATVCAVLMVVAAASAVFGFVNLRRARAADAAAQQARQLAEKARGDAEKLVSYLIEDFYAELEPTGRLETMGKLAQMAVTYYDSLPGGLRTPNTLVNQAMAMVREGSAQAARGDTDASDKSFAAARAIFEKLRAAGDQSEDVTYGLALALYSKQAALFGGPRSNDAELKQAADLLRPLAKSKNASRRVRLLYADTLNHLSHSLPKPDAVAVCDEARAVLVGLGALDLSDLSAASVYADTSDSEARHLLVLNRLDQAERLEKEVSQIAEKVLVQRPGDLRSMMNRYFAADMLSRIARRREDLAAAARYAEASDAAAEDFVRFNPSDMSGWQNWVRARELRTQVYFERGEIGRALATLRQNLELQDDKRPPASLSPMLDTTWFTLAALAARHGDRAGALQDLVRVDKSDREFLGQMESGDPRRVFFDDWHRLRQARVHLWLGDFEEALDASVTTATHASAAAGSSSDVLVVRMRSSIVRNAYATAAIAATRLGRPADAEKMVRQWLATPEDEYFNTDADEDRASATTLLALAQARQGRIDEARKTLAPALLYLRGRQAAHATGTTFRRDFALALYASALSRPADPAGAKARNEDLVEARRQLESVSAEARPLSDVKWISDAIASVGH